MQTFKKQKERREKERQSLRLKAIKAVDNMVEGKWEGGRGGVRQHIVDWVASKRSVALGSAATFRLPAKSELMPLYMQHGQTGNRNCYGQV